MRFYRAKRDVNDDLYSKIIRHGKDRCDRCLKVRDLQCCHIMNRGNYSTRFMIKPIKNAVALCSTCHDWFDSTRSKDILFDERLQKIKQTDNRWYWLTTIGYTWQDLIRLYAISEQPFQGYKFKKKEITKELKSILESL